jgi:hypothetical protein
MSDDILKSFIKEETNNSKSTGRSSNTSNENIDTQKEQMLYGREYISIDLNSLPTGQFYRPGTRISIRAATVAEVQEYSVVDDSNIIDVTDKMNYILSRCVRFIYSDNKHGTYKDIKDSDRVALIFMIRELTFQKGNNLAKEVTCGHCDHEFKIEFRATNSQSHKKTFIHHKLDSELEEFFNPSTKTIDITINNKLWKLAPPTIGLQEIFFEDLKEKVQQENKSPKVSFLKVFPFTLWDRSSISKEGIKQKEKDYQSLDMETFQTLNYIVDKMKFGVTGLEINCPVCGGEVHTDMTFPGGSSNIFVVSSPLGRFKKE